MTHKPTVATATPDESVPVWHRRGLCGIEGSQIVAEETAVLGLRGQFDLAMTALRR